LIKIDGSLKRANRRAKALEAESQITDDVWHMNNNRLQLEFSAIRD